MSDYANMRAELDAANKRIAELEDQLNPVSRKTSPAAPPHAEQAHADATKPAHHENEHERERGKR